MQFQQSLRTALITLLAVAATTCTPSFLGLIARSPTLAQTPNASKADADRLLQQGGQQYRTGQFQAALQSLQQALIIYRQIGDRAGEGTTLIGIGSVYTNLGQYLNALQNYQQALVVAKQLGYQEEEGIILNTIGVVYERLGQYSNALKFSQQALEIRK